MRLVVVGGVAAGMSAAARAKRLDPSIEVVVCEKGPHVSFGACGLPYLLEGRVRDFRQLVVRDAAQWQARGIDLRTNTEVRAIQHSRRAVRLHTGEEISYDKLLVATGALPLLPEISGSANAFALHRVADMLRLREYLDAAAGPGKTLIAGASFLALEAAEALRARGWQVTLAHPGTDLMRRGDPWLTERLKAHLARCGVEVRHGVRVDGPDDRFDITLFATGLRPNTDLAKEAGLRLGRTGAIEVDDRMETATAGILAAGDCAEATHLVTGRPVWAPLGTIANKMGRVAGATVAGRRERFPGITGTSITRVCGLGVGLTGLSLSQARREGFDPVEAAIDVATERARYFRGRPLAVKLVADRRSGRLTGGCVVGDAGVSGRINTIATALTARLTVEQFAQLDLAYAPPFSVVWDPLLVAAQQLLHAL